MSALPANISVSSARLPQTYEAAKTALAECSAVDECKDWADKAAALASYAKQSNDDTLEKLAMRIRARAIRRAGELLKQIEPATGKNNQYAQVKEAADRPLHSRSEAAREAGLSPYQQKTALRVANVPEPDFDAQVESEQPPTLTHLAQQGIQHREPPPDPQQWLKGRDPKAFNRALHFTADITNYADDLAKWDLSVLEYLDEGQRVEIRAALQKIDAIHDQIATRI